MSKEVMMSEKELIEYNKAMCFESSDVDEHIMYLNGFVVYHEKNKKILVDKRKKK